MNLKEHKSSTDKTYYTFDMVVEVLGKACLSTGWRYWVESGHVSTPTFQSRKVRGQMHESFKWVDQPLRERIGRCVERVLQDEVLTQDELAAKWEAEKGEH